MEVSTLMSIINKYNTMSNNVAKQLDLEKEGTIEHRCLNALLKDYMLKVDILSEVLRDVDSGLLSKDLDVSRPKLNIKSSNKSTIKSSNKSTKVGKYSTTGKVCTFKGYDYKDLYGYNFSDDRYKELSERVKNVIIDLIEKKGCDTFITGGSLGFDKIVYYVVDALKMKYPHIKNCLAIPFKNQNSKWYANDLNDYEYMKEKANSVVYVDTVEGYNTTGGEVGVFNPKKLKVCHEYMIDNSDYMVALYRGDDKGGVSYCISYAKSKKLDGVYVLNPDML